MEEEVKDYYDHKRCVPVIDPADPEYKIKLDQRIKDFDNKRDARILDKIRNPMSKEQYLKEHPDDIENRSTRTENWTFEGLARKGRELIRKRELEERLRELEELEEEMELDNILEGQVDETVDETIEPLYCNAVYNKNKRKSNHTAIPSDLAIPEKFFTWSKLFQDNWISGKIQEYGYEAVKNLFENDS